MRKKTGPKITKPSRSSELYRINNTNIIRLNTLKTIRQEVEPRISTSDLINEAIELLMDAECIADIPMVDKRLGVEL